jgi:hypothetical protein
MSRAVRAVGIGFALVALARAHRGRGSFAARSPAEWLLLD